MGLPATLRGILLLSWGVWSYAYRLTEERIVFQTNHGDIEMALYPDVAPVTVTHILKLAQLGCYNANHFFRVDKGFVAQTADVLGGRGAAGVNAEQKEVAQKTVPLEVRQDVKHDKRGILSMARHSDPNSGGSSFSILLGAAPHLDMQYTIFGEVVKGFEALTSMEQVETVKEGIFVMPKERISIHSSYVYRPVDSGSCQEELLSLKSRFDSQSALLEKIRSLKLP